MAHTHTGTQSPIYRPSTVAGHVAVRRYAGAAFSLDPPAAALSATASPLAVSRAALSPTPGMKKRLDQVSGNFDGSPWRTSSTPTRYRSLAMQYHSLLCEQLGVPLQPSDTPDIERAKTTMKLFREFADSIEPLKAVLEFFLAEFCRYIYTDTGFAFNPGTKIRYSDEPFFAVVSRLENEKVDAVAESTELKGKLSRVVTEFQRRVASLEQETLGLRSRSEEVAEELSVVRQERDSLTVDMKRFEREGRNATQELLNLQHRNAQLLERNSTMKVDRDKLAGEVDALRENILSLTNQLRNSIASLGEKEAECLNHVPVSEVEELRKHIPDLEGTIARQRKAIAQLANKIKQRDGRIEALSGDLETASTKLNENERQMTSMTPRPDWFEVSTYVPTLVLENASSQQLVDDTCAEIQKLKVEIESIKSDGAAPTYGAPGHGGSGSGVQRGGGEEKPQNLKDFVGRGTGPHVPKYLRANGRIRHRFIKKRECERLIKDVWDLKAVHDGNPLQRLSLSSKPPEEIADLLGMGKDKEKLEATTTQSAAMMLMRIGTMGPRKPPTTPSVGGRSGSAARERPERGKKKTKKVKKVVDTEAEDAKAATAERQSIAQRLLDEVADVDRVPLGEFLYQYLQKKFETHMLVVEFGYALMAALQRYAYDADCELFLKILTGEVSEDCYYDQMIMLEQLFEAMQHLDKTTSSDGETTGTIMKKDLTKMLRDFFSVKSDDNFRRMIRALNLDVPGNVIEYAKLFEEDREGNQGEFIECVRDQHLSEVVEYTAEIEAAIRERSDRQGLVTLRDSRNGMLEVDPAKPSEVVMHHVSQGAGQHPMDPIDDLDKSLSADWFISNLKKGFLRRYTKKEDHELPQ